MSLSPVRPTAPARPAERVAPAPAAPSAPPVRGPDVTVELGAETPGAAGLGARLRDWRALDLLDDRRRQARGELAVARRALDERTARNAPTRAAARALLAALAAGELPAPPPAEPREGPGADVGADVGADAGGGFWLADALDALALLAGGEPEEAIARAGAPTPDGEEGIRAPLFLALGALRARLGSAGRCAVAALAAQRPEGLDPAAIPLLDAHARGAFDAGAREAIEALVNGWVAAVAGSPRRAEREVRRWSTALGALAPRVPEELFPALRAATGESWPAVAAALRGAALPEGVERWCATLDAEAAELADAALEGAAPHPLPRVTPHGSPFAAVPAAVLATVPDSVPATVSAAPRATPRAMPRITPHGMPHGMPPVPLDGVRPAALDAVLDAAVDAALASLVAAPDAEEAALTARVRDAHARLRGPADDRNGDAAGAAPPPETVSHADPDEVARVAPGARRGATPDAVQETAREPAREAPGEPATPDGLRAPELSPAPFGQWLATIAMAPARVGASPALRRWAIRRARAWILGAFDLLAEEARANPARDVAVALEGWRGRLGHPDGGGALVQSLDAMMRRRGAASELSVRGPHGAGLLLGAGVLLVALGVAFRAWGLALAGGAAVAGWWMARLSHGHRRERARAAASMAHARAVAALRTVAEEWAAVRRDLAEGVARLPAARDRLRRMLAR